MTPRPVKHRRLENYLRTFRKRLGFTQQEVAMLLGCSDGSEVSRHERFGQRPALATAFLYGLLFCVPLEELFAGVYDEAGEDLIHRVSRLVEELKKHPNAGVLRKRQFLEGLLSNNLSDPQQ